MICDDEFGSNCGLRNYGKHRCSKIVETTVVNGKATFIDHSGPHICTCRPRS